MKYVSPQVKDILGYGNEDALGKWTDFISDHPINEIGFQNTVKAIETGQPQPPYELELIHKNGRKVWVEVREAPVVENGKTVSIVGSLTDITERKKAEQEIKASEERYRTLVESSTDAIFMLDTDRKITSCNQAFCNLFGYSRDEVEGKSVRIIHASDESFRSFGELAYPIVKRQGFFRGEWEFARKDGTKVPIEIVISSIPSFDGSITGYVSVVRDITERRKMEEALRASETKYRKLHESMMDGFVYTDMQGMILDCNEVYQRMLGYNFMELSKLTYIDLTPEKWHAFEQRIVEEQILPRGFSEVYEKEYRKKDGTIFPVELRVFLIKNDAGENEGMWAIVRDITERKRAEQERAELQDQLRQAQKMEAIGQLARGIAHDFNNLLTVIKGTCQLSLLDLNEKDPLYGNLKEIERSAERAADLTRQLLDSYI